MERPVQLASKLLIALVCTMAACHTTPGNRLLLYVNTNDTQLVQKQGILYHHAVPFSGVAFSLFTNGDTAVIQPYTSGKQHGLEQRWYSKGWLAEERPYVHGRKEGVHRGWWEHGGQKFVYQFKNDEYNGEVKEWYASGPLARVFTYVNGYENGAQKWWWENGGIRANYIVKHGERYGLIGQKLCGTDTKTTTP